MKTFKLNDFLGGWFVGDFDPSVIKTPNAEVCIKHYPVGFSEAPHIHKIAEEVTVVIGGQVMVNGVQYGPGDILLIGKNEAIDFETLTDVVTCVVKIPSIKGDKYATNH